MHSFSAAMEYDIADPQANSGIRQRRPLADRKRNRQFCRRQLDKGNPRQIFNAAKRMETAQTQPRQARIEISARGDDDAGGSNSGTVIVRIAKRCRAVLSHPLHLTRRANRDHPAHRMENRLRVRYATSESSSSLRFRCIGRVDHGSRPSMLFRTARHLPNPHRHTAPGFRSIPDARPIVDELTRRRHFVTPRA